MGNRRLSVMMFSTAMSVTVSAADGAIVQPSLSAWADQASTSRADLLIIGDSVVHAGGDGWDAGLIQAARQHFGLAGSGLIPHSHDTAEGDGYGVAAWDAKWSRASTAAVAGSAGLIWKGMSVTAGALPANNYGYWLDGGSIDPGAPIDLDVWSVGTGPTASVSAFRRSSTLVYGTRTGTHSAASNGVLHSQFSFSRTDSSDAQDVMLQNVTDRTILYSRVSTPSAKGVTVTSWGYGGKSTLDFLNEQYLPMSLEGRSAWLRSMVAGGSGKLNVVIAEGFNDRNERDPSVSGIAIGNSPAAFRDNVQHLIELIRSDWANGGLAGGDLSFTVLGMYEIQGDNELLRDYAGELESLAASSPDVSFLDLHEMVPTFAAAQELGYFTDGIHLSRAGALAYSNVIMATVPEPSLGVIAGLGLTVLGMQRRSSRL